MPRRKPRAVQRRLAEFPPKRLQRSRRRGWRMPAGAVYVGRPTGWGNPFVPGDRTPGSVQAAVKAFREWAEMKIAADPQWLDRLRGKDLVCWCPLDRPCHADVLLELANREVQHA